MQGIYIYIPETIYVPREYSFAAILLLLFMVHTSHIFLYTSPSFFFSSRFFTLLSILGLIYSQYLHSLTVASLYISKCSAKRETR